MKNKLVRGKSFNILRAARREYYARKLAEAEERGDTKAAQDLLDEFKARTLKDLKRSQEARSTEEAITL